MFIGHELAQKGKALENARAVHHEQSREGKQGNNKIDRHCALEISPPLCNVQKVQVSNRGIDPFLLHTDTSTVASQRAD